MNNIENIYKFADSLACETKLNEPIGLLFINFLSNIFSTKI